MKNKSVIITGGAQGIGKCMAKTFFENGAKVIIVDNDGEAGKETAGEFKGLHFIKADVSSEEDAKKTITETIKLYKGIDVLINNAGIGISAPLSRLKLSEWEKVINVNLTGAFLFSKYCARYLEKAGGSIINISSTRGLMSEADTEAYAASKGGITALTHAMAVSLGPRVRVNAISPGWIEVSDWKKKSQREKPKHSKEDKKQHPAGRVGKPEDIAETALYLASEKASFITGQNFIIDGGMTKKMIYAE